MKKILLFGSFAILSITSFSCTTDENQTIEETSKTQAIVYGPGDDPIIPPPPPKKQSVVSKGPGDAPIIVPPPPIKKQSVVSKGPGDATIPVPPPPKPK